MRCLAVRLSPDGEVNSRANSIWGLSWGAAQLLFVTVLPPPMLLALSSCVCCVVWVSLLFCFLFSFQNYSLLFKYFQERKENVY